MYYSKKVIIPQKWHEYGTGQVNGRLYMSTWTRHTAAHEIGHAVADINEDYYFNSSDVEKFKDAKKVTLKDMMKQKSL